MKLTILALLPAALVACGKDAPEGPLVEGMSRVHMEVDVKRDDDGPEHFLNLGFDLVRTKRLEPGEHMWLRSACQVGGHRIFDDSPMSLDSPGHGEKPFVYGVRNRIVDHPYLINPLRAWPSQCDFALMLGTYAGDADDEELSRWCVTEEGAKPGACPPNPSTPPPSGPPVTVDQLRMSIDPANDLFPEALLLRYVVTAHAEMQRGDQARVAVECGGRVDDVFHSDLQHLRPGESFQAGQLKFQGRIPPPSTACNVVFQLARRGENAGEVFAQYCWVNGELTRGACG